MKSKPKIIGAVAVLAAWMAMSGQVQAAIIDFESGPFGAQANGFAAIGHPEVTFTDTVGANLRVQDFGVQGDGQALGVNGDTDGSKLQIDFAVGIDFFALDFGNDDPNFTTPTDLAWLEVYNNNALVATVTAALNRDDIMNQTIKFGGAVIDQAVFWYGNADGNPFTGPRTGLIEVVDNIEYNVVPEPAMLALFGAGLLAFGLARRRPQI